MFFVKIEDSSGPAETCSDLRLVVSAIDTEVAGSTIRENMEGERLILLNGDIVFDSKMLKDEPAKDTVFAGSEVGIVAIRIFGTEVKATRLRFRVDEGDQKAPSTQVFLSEAEDAMSRKDVVD